MRPALSAGQSVHNLGGVRPVRHERVVKAGQRAFRRLDLDDTAGVLHDNRKDATIGGIPRRRLDPDLEDGTDEDERDHAALAGGRAVSIFGADVARQVLALGRLDEIVVQIVPVVLGDGVRLFGETPTPDARLERTYVSTSGTLTDIRFRVIGPMHSARAAS
jgi:hypothetical protein